MADDVPRLRVNSLRLPHYDYSQPGWYFITVCLRDRLRLFGEVIASEVRLSEAGSMVRAVWEGLPHRFCRLKVDSLVVMPDHVHGLLVLTSRDREAAGCEIESECDLHRKHEVERQHEVRPKGPTLGRIMQAFKSITTHEYILGVRQKGWPPFRGRLWQRNYHDHVIRGARMLERIRRYITDNPCRWATRNP